MRNYHPCTLSISAIALIFFGSVPLVAEDVLSAPQRGVVTLPDGTEIAGTIMVSAEGEIRITDNQIFGQNTLLFQKAEISSVRLFRLGKVKTPAGIERVWIVTQADGQIVYEPVAIPRLRLRLPQTALFEESDNVETKENRPHPTHWRFDIGGGFLPVAGQLRQAFGHLWVASVGLYRFFPSRYLPELGLTASGGYGQSGHRSYTALIFATEARWQIWSLPRYAISVWGGIVPGLAIERAQSQYFSSIFVSWTAAANLRVTYAFAQNLALTLVGQVTYIHDLKTPLIAPGLIAGFQWQF